MGVIDNDGTILTEPIYDQVSFLDTNWFTFKVNEDWSLMHEKELLFKASYDSITRLTQEIFLLTKGDSSYFFNSQSRQKSTNAYESGTVRDDFVLAKKGDQISLLDLGDLVEFYQNAKSYSELYGPYRLIQMEERHQLLDTNKKQLLFKEYDQIRLSNQEFLIASKGSDCYYLNMEDKKEFYLPQLDEIISIDFPLMTFESEGSIGIFDLSESELIIPPAFDGINASGNHLYVKKNGLYGLYSSTGKEIITTSFTTVSYTHLTLPTTPYV